MTAAVLLLLLFSLLCALVGTGMAWFWLRAYRTGVFSGRSQRTGKIRIVKRQEEPIVFWISMAIAGGGLCFFYAFAFLFFLNALAFNSVQS
ncbi:MAG: hypothetical protein AAGL17_14780 [Cyanobacteria bacterium J06576_12]